jgi:hypothetical protein
MRKFLTLILLGLAAVSCSPSAHVNPNPPEAANSTPVVISPIIGNPTPIPVDPIQGNTANPTPVLTTEKYVDLAKQDLAARLKIETAQITVLHVTEITAADLYSGCTLKAGQFLMPNDSANGYQISLQAQGQDYLYHAGSNDQIVLCQYLNPGGNKPFHNPTTVPTQPILNP